jgi:beta-xylosidase
MQRSLPERASRDKLAHDRIGRFCVRCVPHLRCGERHIEAHGAGLILVGDTWYWVGEDKSQNSGNFNAVNAYSSKDLSNWQFRNAIITKATSTELAASGRIIERPKVIYNATTQQYVMWLHWDGDSYATAEAGVFTCATVDGDYKLSSHFQPNGNMSRDDTLFKDDDGKAYFISAANENSDLMMYELSDDYLTIKRQVLRLSTAKREAPAMFKQGGRYYLITSAATGWDPNQAQYFSAAAVDGPWTALTNIGDSTTYVRNRRT